METFYGTGRRPLVWGFFNRRRALTGRRLLRRTHHLKCRGLEEWARVNEHRAPTHLQPRMSLRLPVAHTINLEHGRTP